MIQQRMLFVLRSISCCRILLRFHCVNLFILLASVTVLKLCCKLLISAWNFIFGMNPHSLLDYIFFNDNVMQIHSECVCLFMHVKAQAMMNKHEILIVEMNVLCEKNVFC